MYSVIPHFAKVHLAPLCFYERPRLVPVVASQKKSEEDFHFYEKRQKKKIVLDVCFAVAVTEAQLTPSSDAGTTKLLPRKHSQHLSITSPEL